MENQESDPKGAFKDRSGWLSAAGIVEVVLGCLCAIVCLLLPFFSLFASRVPETTDLLDTRTVILSGLVFLILAVSLVWLGIGTFKARMWARDLMLIASWLWLIFGAISWIILLLMMPRAISGLTPPGQEPLSGEIIMAVVVINAVFLGFFYIVLPGISVFFYSGRNVRRTFETRDTDARWTSKCPLSVLTLSQFLAGGAIYLLVMPFYANALPFFGRLLTGFPSSLIAIMMALFLGYLTWATYKLKVHAWWATLLFSLFGLLSVILTFARMDPMEYFRTAGLPPQQIDMLRNTGMLSDSVLSLGFGLVALAWLGFLLVIRRHFKHSGGRPRASRPAT